MVKLWANASEKTQACNIRREAKAKGLPIPSNDEIVLMLRAKQINSPPEKPSGKTLPPANPPGSVASPGVSLPADLLKIVQYTAQATQLCPSWRPADTLAYLDKSKQILQTAQEADQLVKAASVDELLAQIQPERSLPNARSPSTNISAPSSCPTPSATDN